jgi:hypothetical protein
MSNLHHYSEEKDYQRRRLKKIKCAEKLGAESPSRWMAEETSKDTEGRAEKLAWKISVRVGNWRKDSGEDR